MFKVNDRVRCTGFKNDPDQAMFITVGDTGTVEMAHPKALGQTLSVKWDNPVSTECNGVWWVDSYDCELAE